ncbi:AMP-binding protein [Lentibacillus sp. L22]|uniref:class I adenylate-forming enzyme family protein n=1 Tax=Lentibacillus TaxID=175304 RepID=UPI0022B15188|nr:AMP-binding protein [Lentibacillus daqui]
MVKSVTERRHDIESQFPVWKRKTLGAHFAERAQKYPDRPLLLTADREYTYMDVWNESIQVARALMALGVKRRDHVALLMENRPEFISLKIAVSLVGAVCVPINTMLREDELEYTLRQSDTNWLFFHQTIKKTNYAEIIDRLIDQNKLQDIHGKHVMQQAICIPNQPSSGGSERFIVWDDFLAKSSSVAMDVLQERIDHSEYPDEIVDIIYTSGTTGLPKGVMLTHDMVLRCGFSSALSRAFEDGRRIFTTLPMYHVFAYIEGILSATYVGGALVLTTESTPKSMLTLMEKTRATDFLGVPSMLLSILHYPDLKKYDLTSLFSLLCAAAPAPIPVWKQAIQELGLTEICTAYGGTEATAATVHTEVGDSVAIVSTRVGRMKPGGSSGLAEFGGANTQYKVVDPFTKEDIDPNTPGELVVRGNIVTNGYYNKPEETAAAIDKDGWFYTGDLGRIDEHGYIEFLGKSKDLYKVSGENVAPKEVEEVISNHDAVKQVYVVGVPDAITGEIGAAFVELKAGKKLKRRDIVNLCREQLAKFKVPRYVWFIEEADWPYTGNGKIQKFRLVEAAKKYLGKNATETKEANEWQ